MKKKPQIRQLGIKVTLLRLLDSIANPKLSYWEKSVAMSEFCLIGSNIARNEIYKEFINSRKFKDEVLVAMEDNDGYSILHGDVEGTVRWWQKIYIEDLKRPPTVSWERGIPDDIRNAYGWTPEQYKEVAKEHMGSHCMDMMQGAFNYIFNKLMDTGILKLNETIDVSISMEDKEEEHGRGIQQPAEGIQPRAHGDVPEGDTEF